MLQIKVQCRALRPNGPELSCGDEVPQRRNPVRAWQVQSDSNWLFRAAKSSTAGSVSLSDWLGRSGCK